MVARVALWGGVRLGVKKVPETEAFRWTNDVEYQFPREVQSIRYVVRIITVSGCFSKARLIPGSRISQAARGYGVAGMKGCQSMPWSEELDGKELHGAAWWRRSGAEKTHFFLYTKSTQPFRASTNVMLCWF